MDGSLAVIFIITGLTDMWLNDCATGCLTRSNATANLNLQAGDLQFQSGSIGEEIYAAYDMGHNYGPFQPTIGASTTSTGDTWIGVGAKWTTAHIIDSAFFVETSLMSGLYAQGNGPNIGGAVQFRSAIGAGYSFDNGNSLTLLYDHRSNGDTQARNPGLETLSIRYAIELN